MRRLVLGIAGVMLLAACQADRTPHRPGSTPASQASSAPAASPATGVHVSSAGAPSSPRQSPVPSTARRPTLHPGTTDSDSGRTLISHVRWTTTSKGRQLQIFPTHAGRTDQSPAASGRAWAEVLHDAHSAASPGMHDQFLCHWNFARIVQPDKPSWNLEPWRPAVGYQATVAALCNPGGAES